MGWRSLGAVLCLALVGCVRFGFDPPPRESDGGPQGQVSGDYVVSQLLLPLSSIRSEFGLILASVVLKFGGDDLGLQGKVDTSVNSGATLVLLRLDRDGDAIAATMWTGEPRVCCTALEPAACAAQAQAGCFGGSQRFAVSGQANRLEGEINEHGRFEVGPARLSMSLALLDPVDRTTIASFSGDLDEAYIVGIATGDGISDGEVRGNIDRQTVDTDLISLLATLFNYAYFDDPTTQSTVLDELEEQFPGLAQANPVDEDDVRENFWIKSFLGNLGDAMSMHVNFAAVPASIDAP